MIWLLPPLVLLVCLWALNRKLRPGRVRRRTEQHEAFLAFLTEILAEPKIRETMIERRTATRESLLALQATMGQLHFPGLKAIAARLLVDRVVRQAVARYMVAAHGVTQQRFMMQMSEMVGEARG